MQKKQTILVLIICLFIFFQMPSVAHADDTVRIGHARIDERGEATGGQMGDQTGNEVAITKWYCHEQGWIIFRAKSPLVREKIASTMEACCANDNIGYDQFPPVSLYLRALEVDFDIEKIDKPCGSDCSKTVWVCVLAAGIDCEYFSTYYEKDRLMATGAFEMIDDPSISNVKDYLYRGDILCSVGKGHTVVVLDDGPLATHEPAPLFPFLKNFINSAHFPVKSMLLPGMRLTYQAYFQNIMKLQPSLWSTAIDR